MAISNNINALQTSALANAPIYSAAQLMSFAVSEMPPNTRIYVYCNDINISEFCAPALQTAQVGQPIVTNALGTASGYLYKSIDFTDKGQNYSFVEKVELVAKNDFVSYAAQAGFSLVDLKGDYKLSPFDEAASPRMIFVWAKTTF
jgi:hypothetical protein